MKANTAKQRKTQSTTATRPEGGAIDMNATAIYETETQAIAVLLAAHVVEAFARQFGTSPLENLAKAVNSGRGFVDENGDCGDWDAIFGEGGNALDGRAINEFMDLHANIVSDEQFVDVCEIALDEYFLDERWHHMAYKLALNKIEQEKKTKKKAA